MYYTIKKVVFRFHCNLRFVGGNVFFLSNGLTYKVFEKNPISPERHF